MKVDEGEVAYLTEVDVELEGSGASEIAMQLARVFGSVPIKKRHGATVVRAAHAQGPVDARHCLSSVASALAELRRTEKTSSALAVRLTVEVNRECGPLALTSDLFGAIGGVHGRIEVLLWAIDTDAALRDQGHLALDDGAALTALSAFPAASEVRISRRASEAPSGSTRVAWGGRDDGDSQTITIADRTGLMDLSIAEALDAWLDGSQPGDTEFARAVASVSLAALAEPRLITIDENECARLAQAEVEVLLDAFPSAQVARARSWV